MKRPERELAEGPVMSIVETKSAYAEPTAVAIELAKMFTVTADGSNPAYLVLTTLDRNEYTAGSSGVTGFLSGNGATASLGSIGGDARATGIVFSYQASSGHYVSGSFGDLDQVIFTSSSNAGDVCDVSLFGTGNLSLANGYARSPYGMMQNDAAGFIGTATVVTQPSLMGAVPAQATPDGIAQAARNLVGQYWNQEGCWTLASTIAADAGAALPMQSSLTGLAGQASGEWIVAFNGPTGQTGDWQSMVKAGEIVVIGTAGGGHVTTVVSGAGATAMVVDNTRDVNAAGQVLNSAHDGGGDVVIETGHSAAREWAGVQRSTVVIYQLDAPIVTAVASASLVAGGSVSLASLFSGSDPAGRAITEWQITNSAADDALVCEGADHFGASNSATALTTASLGSVALLAGAAAATDRLEVRAFNGSFWGDWQSVAVAVTAPMVSAGGQVWTDGQAVDFQVSPAMLSDGLKLPMHFAAFVVYGADLLWWLPIEAASGALVGTVPATASGSVEIAVVVTGALKLTETDLFSVTFASGSEQVTSGVAVVSPGMGVLFDAPAPSNMLAFHS